MEINETTYFEACVKYPDVSPFVILKIDMQRRGFIMSQQAMHKINSQRYQTKERTFSRELQENYPVSFMLRDGTSVITRPCFNGSNELEPYVIDFRGKKFIVSMSGIEIDEIYLWEKPDFYEKYTSKGTPMWHIANARPQRLDINPFQYCDFWNYGKECRFCEIVSTYNKVGEKPMFLDMMDIEETVAEALKEKGRYASVFLTGGCRVSGVRPFDDEVDLYIEVLRVIGKFFSTDKFPSQLIGAAYNQEQLRRLHDETGLMFYTSDIEVLNKELFAWICPGKNAFVGYEQWKLRLFQAVEIFGRGNVNTGIVGGVELALPNGFKEEERALEVTLTEARELFENGVSVVSCVWRIASGSLFARQTLPSLDYYIKLSKGLSLLRKKYGLYTGMDDYRRCGNHPDTDLDRI